MNYGFVLSYLVAIAILGVAFEFVVPDSSLLWQFGGFLFVFGLTITAAFISFRPGQVVGVFRVFSVILRNERLHPERDIREIIKVAFALAKKNRVMIDKAVSDASNPFLRMAAGMATDPSYKTEDINRILSWRIAQRKEIENAEIQVLNSMASNAPMFGMIGTLLGLVAMLSTAGGTDISAIMTGMSTALLTTFYGLLLAGLVFRPIAAKFEQRLRHRLREMNLIIECLMVIRAEASVGAVNELLNTYIDALKHPLEFDIEAP